MEADTLARQVEELSVLRAMYCGAGEFSSASTPDGMMTLIVTLALEDAQGRSVELHATLPANYPSSPPAIDISCTCLGAKSLTAIHAELAEIASAAAAEDSEVLAELCITMQQSASQRLLDEQEAATQASQPPAPSVSSSSPAGAFGQAMVWFHHIKSLEKRKTIVSLARSLQLRGFCKPGFPGVLVVEGRDQSCDEFLSAVREMRWQAMDVRWRYTQAVEPPTGAGSRGNGSGSTGSTDSSSNGSNGSNGSSTDSSSNGSSNGSSSSIQRSGRLPQPFIELAESGMGEAAGLCASAGLLPTFRSAVLKLDHGSECVDGDLGSCVISKWEGGGGGSNGGVGGSNGGGGGDGYSCSSASDGPADVSDAGAGGTASSSSAGGHSTDESDVLLVVHIDHMNDRGGYTKHLQKWCIQLGLGATLIFAGRLATRGSTSKPASHHAATNILCVLRGAAESTKQVRCARALCEHSRSRALA